MCCEWKETSCRKENLSRWMQNAMISFSFLQLVPALACGFDLFLKLQRVCPQVNLLGVCTCRPLYWNAVSAGLLSFKTRWQQWPRIVTHWYKHEVAPLCSAPVRNTRLWLQQQSLSLRTQQEVTSRQQEEEMSWREMNVFLFFLAFYRNRSSKSISTWTEWPKLKIYTPEWTQRKPELWIYLLCGRSSWVSSSFCCFVYLFSQCVYCLLIGQSAFLGIVLIGRTNTPRGNVYICMCVCVWVPPFFLFIPLFILQFFLCH